MLPQQYCLRWKYHHSNLQTMFSQLLDRGCFCDVTLACEGQLIRAHRVVLCACSSYFDTVLTNYSNERDPIIIMKDVTFADVKCLIEFMYKGEINVEHAHLASLLKTADDLKIKGLAEVTWRENEDDGPPMPTPTAEYYSPRHAAKAYYGNDAVQRRTPSPPTAAEELTLRNTNTRTRMRSPTPQPLPLKVQTRMPTLTPIPHNVVDNCLPMHVSPNVEHYLGVKRKRGRPPLDDTYDVFNLRQQYANMEHHAYLEATRQYAEEQQKQLQLHHQQQQQQQQQRKQEQQQRQELRERCATPTSKTVAAAAAYQEHVQQHQIKQRIMQQQREHAESVSAAAAAAVEVQMAEAQPEPEWISSNLEVNVTEVTPDKPHPSGESVEEQQREAHVGMSTTAEETAGTSIDDTASAVTKQEHINDCSESNDTGVKSPLEQKCETGEVNDGHNVPKPVEELENLDQHQQTEHTKSASATPTPSTSPTALKTQPSQIAPTNALPATATQSTLPAHVSHYNKYAPEGYLVNEHGILMAPDFVHAPTVAIPSVAAANSAAGSSQANNSCATAADQHAEYTDIKMEDFDAADLRLTSEEITQWQDVIKMDDYLAKGRRPQFWEEPFTRRVLDAIKNKHLEMKKAARILGVSYGTLYGRYREVYGCLKHPYSGTSLRPNQLSLPPRLDYPFRNAAPATLPAQLEIGKIRPKDLSELWARPQI